MLAEAVTMGKARQAKVLNLGPGLSNARQVGGDTQ